MNIGIIGCGYVCDTYLATWKTHPNLVLKGVSDRDPARAAAVSDLYGLRRYSSNAEMLADPEVEAVVNLTSIESHGEVTRAALLAGKHVYSEKPLTTDLDEARELLALAGERGLALSCAPCNALGPTAQTTWRALRDGVVGTPLLVYAELDDNPIYLMSPEVWRSPSGAPWPYRHEYEQGCTVEHLGYYLTWLCAMFGPVASLTAFSKMTVPEKTPLPLDPPDTPDFSVACLDFVCGVTARVTCSIAAPLDHRMRIVGDKGVLTADTAWHDDSPVRLERFNKLNLNARKSLSVRRNSFLQALFGVGGRRLKLIRSAPPGSASGAAPSGGRGWSPRALLVRLKGREIGRLDKCLGIAAMVDNIAAGRPCFPAPDFLLHVTELLLATQRAGPGGVTLKMATRFEPVAPRPETLQAPVDYRAALRMPLLARLSERLIDRLHQH